MSDDYHPSNLSQDLKSSNGNEGDKENVGLVIDVTRESVCSKYHCCFPTANCRAQFLEQCLELPSLSLKLGDQFPFLIRISISQAFALVQSF